MKAVESTNKKPEPVVLKNTTDPPEILASAIKDVAEAARKLLSSKLTKRAIVILLKDSIGYISMKDIELVLDHAACLDKFVKR
jgi:hypothetical protein